MLLGAALTARRGSLYPDEGAAEVATVSVYVYPCVCIRVCVC